MANEENVENTVPRANARELNERMIKAESDYTEGLKKQFSQDNRLTKVNKIQNREDIVIPETQKHIAEENAKTEVVAEPLGDNEIISGNVSNIMESTPATVANGTSNTIEDTKHNPQNAPHPIKDEMEQAQGVQSNQMIKKESWIKRFFSKIFGKKKKNPETPVQQTVDNPLMQPAQIPEQVQQRLQQQAQNQVPQGVRPNQQQSANQKFKLGIEPLPENDAPELEGFENDQFANVQGNNNNQ